MAERSGTSSGLNKLFPITVMFGDEAEGDFKLATVVGAFQGDDNSRHTDLKYTGRGWRGNAGISVRTKTIPVSIRDAFNVLTEAHKAGEIADLTDQAIEEKGLTYKSNDKGLMARLFG